MHELLHGVGTCVEQDTVSPCEAEQTDGEVFRKELVESDDLERLHYANLVLGEVSEEHGCVASTDVGHIVIEDVGLAEEGRRGSLTGRVLPDVPSCGVLYLGQLPEGVVVEHELAHLGVVGVDALDEVDDVVEGDGGCASGCTAVHCAGDDALRLVGARARGEVLVQTTTEALGKEP